MVGAVPTPSKLNATGEGEEGSQNPFPSRTDSKCRTKGTLNAKRSYRSDGFVSAIRDWYFEHKRSAGLGG
jgi:hypothetical protein